VRDEKEHTPREIRSDIYTVLVNGLYESICSSFEIMDAFVIFERLLNGNIILSFDSKAIFCDAGES
jgi:hypothetical protein